MIGRSVSLAAFCALAFFAGLADRAQAQIRDVDIFYDRYGREVLVDIYTGEVVAVREPRPRRPLYEEWAPREALPRYERPRDYERGGYPPVSRRDERMRELGRLPEYRDYRALPEPDYPLYEDDYYREEAPGWSGEPQWREEPGYALPGEVERQPLDRSPSIATLPDPRFRDPALQDPGLPPLGEVIEEAPARALPDVRVAPEIGTAAASEDVARFQVLLDRLGASPGVIDGRIGDNVNKAIAAYRDLRGETLRTYDKDYIEAQLQATGGDAFKDYEITPVDVAGPFVASIPSDYGEKARMERMGYVSVAEKLAERFHMDERYLRALNPGADFDRPGTIIRVANVGSPLQGEVRRIIADKGRRQVRAYGADGALIAVYPATIGSAATPSPTGTHTVERVALNPEYTYNPRVNFQQGDNTRVLTIPPGPNGPVGSVWIALSKPTYGIHGTPEPSQIGKTESNGCIRLTNWDAEELAGMVKPGVTVEFVE